MDAEEPTIRWTIITVIEAGKIVMGKVVVAPIELKVPLALSETLSRIQCPGTVLGRSMTLLFACLILPNQELCVGPIGGGGDGDSSSPCGHLLFLTNPS